MEKMERNGPAVVKNGVASDVGLWDNVFNGEDDAYERYQKAKILLPILKEELIRRGILPEGATDEAFDAFVDALEPSEEDGDGRMIDAFFDDALNM